jgi:hypothetical protein
MATMRIIPTFRPIKDSHLRLCLTLEAPAIEHFALEGRKERLRIVLAPQAIATARTQS